jgi:ABC-2 type transport system permease protein
VTAPVSAATVAPPVQRVTQLRVIRSEWTKLRTLRSSLLSLLAAVVFIVGFGILVPAVVAANWPPSNPADRAGFEPVAVSLAGAFLAQLAIGVLGVMFITSEYATGMIRATFAAVPRRLPVLWAKTVVFAAVSLVVTAVSTLAAFLIGQSLLSAKGIATDLAQPGVLRAVLGTALYVTVVGLLGLGIGALLRNTAASIATLFGVLLVLPVIVLFLPGGWSTRIGKYLPGNAGGAIMTVRGDPGALSPWAGFGIFCLYAVAVLALAAVALRRRDT